ncbi:MAG: peptidase MA family metallohydrolase [Candidatus Limnocylindrales bacterium]
MSRRLAAALALLALSASVLLPSATALAQGAAPVFDQPSVTVDFPTGATWIQTFSAGERPTRVELVSQLDGSDSWIVQDVPLQDLGPASGGGEAYRAQLDDTGTALPNSLLHYHFRVTLPSGVVDDGPEGSIRITDDRVAWKTLQGTIVRLHWVDGDTTFAQRALRIADDAVASTSKLLGVTETQPIDFFVYGDQTLFQSALPGTKEFVAGLAVAEIRTLFAIIQPSDIGSDWVQVVIPHELTHLVFNTATANPYGVPPHWLNEGLAVYLSEGFVAADRQRQAAAIDQGTLLPLQAIRDGFPQSRQDLFYLAYAEGTSAVDFFIRQYGEAKLVALIRSFATGVTDDEAFKAAIGLDMAGFEAAWLKDIGAAVPHQYGPGSPLPGPTPADWTTGGAAPAQPGASPSTGTSPEGIPSTASSGGGDILSGIVIGLVVGVLIVVGVLVLVRRRRPPATGSRANAPEAPPDLEPAPTADASWAPPSPPPATEDPPS